MTKRLTWTAVALVAAFAIAVSAVAYTNSIACDKNAKNASAKAACDKAAGTASASACSQTASASACSMHAKTASAGCCQGMEAEAGYSKAEGCCKSESAAQQAALKGIVSDLPYAERHRVVVAGTMECGHCTYKATAKCQPLLKTTDGKVYPLVHNHLVKDMRHGQAGTFEISSNVRVMDGIKYLEVKSYRSM